MYWLIVPVIYVDRILGYIKNKPLVNTSHQNDNMKKLYETDSIQITNCRAKTNSFI